MFESPPLRLSAVRPRCSQFSQNISQQFTATCYLFVLICGRFRNHRPLPPLPSEKLLQCFFWRFVDTRPIVWPRLRTHFTDIPNSQLMYAVQLLIIKGGLTLILSFPKAWFLLRVGSPFRFVASSIALFRSLKVLHRRASFVDISRQKPCI